MSLAHLLLPAQGRLQAEDVPVLSRVGSLMPAGWRVGNVQPARSEQRALSRFEAITERKWDLRYRSAEHFDALVVARTSSLPGDSARRLRSALASCRVLVVLESSAPELPPERLLASSSVSNGTLSVYRGDLTDPLLRVDDYPTGVRPILEDLSSLHDVLTQIDDTGLAFHLGIVPAILNGEMAAFLRTLKHLVVCMHGFEHGYAKHSQILLAAGDPSNQRSTVTGFDEFAGKSYPEVEALLREGREALESRLGQTPLCYIPPNNESSRITGRALTALGFELVLTEKRMPGCDLPCIASEFYGRSSAFRADMQPNVASLHATWEADMLRGGDRESLPRFLAALFAQRSRAREEAASFGERVAGALAPG